MWSDAATSFAGRITATGGPSGGNGGYVEVSASPATRGVLDFAGSADLTAPKGTTGTLLLDPYDITIVAGNSATGGSFIGGNWNPTGTSFIGNGTLENQLALSNVTVSTAGAGAEAGNLTVSAPVSWASPNFLGLTADSGIFVNAPIAGGGSLDLNGAASVQINAPISSAAGSIFVSGPTFLGANVAGSSAGIAFTSSVTLTANAAVSAGFASFESTVDGGHFLTVLAGGVNFFDDLGSAAPLAGLSVTGVVNLNGNVTTNNGPITFADAVRLDTSVTINSGAAATTFGSTIDSSCFDCNIPPRRDLTVSAGALSLGGALGGIDPLGAVSLTSAAGMTLPSVTATTLSAEATGAASDLTLATGSTLTVSGAGTAVALGAGRGLINRSGPGAINLIPGARWLIYSADPADDVFGGLDSGNTAVWNTPLGGAVAAAGDRYVFAFQPKITVTAGDLIKLYGRDVTALVAADYTISGLQPGVLGAFLPDTAAAVYTGAPTVLSAGSPAPAPSTAAPYPIIVELGGLVIGDGYGFVAKNGLLAVLPPPFDPGFLPALTQINNPAQSEYDVGGYEQVLPHFTVNCNEPPSLPDPNRYSDPDAALRAISQSFENYFRRCQNPTQTTIADALDAYAAKLQILAPRLPPALRNVPQIIAEAARRARAARSRTEAVAVLRQTAAAVHKEIALVLSEDPQTRSREVRDGDVIAGALGDASVALVNSGDSRVPTRTTRDIPAGIEPRSRMPAPPVGRLIAHRRRRVYGASGGRSTLRDAAGRRSGNDG